MESEDDLAHPVWLRDAISTPTKIWTSWSLLAEREVLRNNAKLSEFYKENEDENEDYNPFSVSVGALEDNRRKNRFGIEAYNRTRVLLSDEDRYVNASYIREGLGGRWWVIAEAPSATAVHAFLSLFIPAEDQEQPVSRMHTIVQLTPQGEGSTHPPDPYFPPNLSQTYTINAERGYDPQPLQVRTVKQKRIPDANCTKTTFTISRPSRKSNLKEMESFEVNHLLFESWPAKTTPNSDGATALMKFINHIYPVNTRPPNPPLYNPYPNRTSQQTDPPIVVHCAEGGRSGTFIAINSLLRKYKCIATPYDDTHNPPHIPPSPLGPPPGDIFVDPVLREVDHDYSCGP